MARRGIVPAVLAIALLALIASRTMRLVDLRRTDESLTSVASRLNEGAFDRALSDFHELPADATLTTKQLSRRDDLLLRAMQGAVSARHPVRKVGMQDFEAHRETAYRFGAGTVSITTEISPTELARRVHGIRIGDRESPVDGGAAVISVDLPADESELALEARLLVTLSSGEEREIPVPGRIRLVRDTTHPAVEITVKGNDRPLSWTTPPTEPSLVIPPGKSATIRVHDPLGLARVKWTLGKSSDNQSFDDRSLRTEYHLNVGAPFWRASAKTALEIEATNRLGNAWRFVMKLDVKGQDWCPVTRVMLGNVELKAAGAVRVKGVKFEIRAVLPDDVDPTHVAIALRGDGLDGPVQLTPRGRAVVANVELPANRRVGISLVRGDHTLRTFVVDTDTAPPSVTVVREDTGEMLAPGARKLPAGTVIRVRVQDDAGVPAEQELRATNLKLVDQSDLPKKLERRFRLAAGDEGKLEVVVHDALGNRGAPRTFEFRAPLPLGIESATVDGHEAGLDMIYLATARPVVKLQFRGEGRATLRLSASGGENPLWSGTVDVGDTTTAYDATVDLLVNDQQVARRVLDVLDASGKSHATFQLLVDRQPPKIRVDGWDNERDGPKTSWVATPGGRLAIEIVESSGQPQVTVTGSVVTAPLRRDGAITQVEIAVPETLPARLVIRAKDLAGNEAGLEFTVEAPAKAAPVAVHLVQDGQKIVHDGPVQIRRPSELAIDVENGQLLKVVLGDREIAIAQDGRTLTDPPAIPKPGPLVVHVRDAAGKDHQVRFLAQLARGVVPQGMRNRLRSARAMLAAGNRAEAGAEAQKLASDAKRASDSWLDPGNFGHFLKEIANFREGTSAGSATEQGTPSLPPRRTNPEDGAELLLVTPAKPGGFDPMYLYRDEVTVDMFRRFIKQVGTDKAFWAGVPNPLNRRRTLRNPEMYREAARRLVGKRTRGTLPIVGMNPTLATAYVHWARRGLEKGTLSVPTPAQWRIAAGHGVAPKAKYPTTGAFPDGANLLHAQALGTKGGAAFGYRRPMLPKAVGSYAPGAYGLQDMAGNAWELVCDESNRWFLLGGSLSSDKEACRLDMVRPATRTDAVLTGLRLVWKPKP